MQNQPMDQFDPNQAPQGESAAQPTPQQPTSSKALPWILVGVLVAAIIGAGGYYA